MEKISSVFLDTKAFKNLRILLVTLTLALFTGCNGSTEANFSETDAQAVNSTDLSYGANTEKLPKVDVCHLRGPNGYILINVNEHSLDAHLAHGDGLPGEEVSGRPGYVFDGSCNVVEACDYGDPVADPNEFDEEGGAGTVIYTVNSTACECSGSTDQNWIEIGTAVVTANVCEIDFTVAVWDENDRDPGDDTESRAALISTPAGNVGIGQFEGGNIAGEIPGGLCDLDPTLPECGGDDSVELP